MAGDRVTLSRGTVRVALALILLVGGGLRFVGLGEIPPGVWVDEAIEGLQGRALLTGERLPDLPGIPFPRWPAWCGVEAVAVRVFGCTPFGIRAPAALAGLVAIVAAWACATRWFGAQAGLVAAAFLATSFWHVTYSRMALPCALAVLEGLVLCAVLLDDRPRRVRHAVVVGAICGLSCFGYAANLVNLPIAVLFVLLRRPSPGSPPDDPGFRWVLIVCGLGIGALMGAAPPEGADRAASVGIAKPGLVMVQAGTVLANWWATVPADGGYWQNVPPGSARFGVASRIVLAAGLLALVFGARIDGRRKAALLVWTILAGLPETLPGGGIHLVRALPQLAPATMIAAVAVAPAAFGRARIRFAAGLVLLVLQGGETGYRWFVGVATSPVAAQAFSAVDRTAAARLRSLAAAAPIRLVHEPGYADAPLLRFHLIEELASGRIVPIERGLVAPRVTDVFRDPVSGQPVLFILEGQAGPAGPKAYGLVNIGGLLADGHSLAVEGRLREAEQHFRRVLAWVPDSMAARRALQITRARSGSGRDPRGD